MGFQILHRSGWVGTGDRPSRKTKVTLNNLLLPAGIAIYDENGVNINGDTADPNLFNEDFWDSRGLLMQPRIRAEILRRGKVK